MASHQRHHQYHDDKFSKALWQAALSKDVKEIHRLIGRHANMKVMSQNGYDKCTPLHWAASEGNMSIIKLLLQSGANINAKSSEHGLMPLHQAAINGHCDVVEFLLLHGAKVEGKDTKHFYSPLLWAAQNGHHKTVSTLLKHGANIDSCDNKDGQTALHLSASQGHLEVIEVLLQNGAGIDTRDSEVKSTPLHAAAGYGQVDAAHLLLQYEADINAQNKSGNTPLHVAAWFGHTDVVHLLISYEAKLTVKNKYGRIPLDTAEVSNQYKSKTARAEVMKMLDSADKILRLHDATLKGNVSEVKDISSGLKEGVNVMVEFDYENTSESDKLSPVHEAAERGDADVIQVLVDNGADVNIRTPEWGYTALHRAAQYGHNEAAETLLKNKADTESRDYKHGVTPIHLAAVADHTETVNLLYHYDAYLDAQDKYGYTPLHRAASHGHIRTVKLLVKHGADIEIRNDIHEHTPLHVAVIHGHEEVAEELVQYHARIDSQNTDGNTILHLAAAHGCSTFAENIVVGIFPHHVRYMEIKNKDGDTPLHLAAMFGNIRIIRLLVLYGCQLDITNNDGVTARRLIKMSPQYESKADRKTALKILDTAAAAQAELLTAAFLVIAQKYHKKWIELAKKLDILNFQIKTISEKNPGDSTKQCYEMLVLWSLKNFYDTDLFQKLLAMLRSWRSYKLVNQVIVKYHERMQEIFKNKKV